METVAPTQQFKQYHLTILQLDEESYISRSLVFDVQRKLDRIITTAPQETAIDIWIESGGGDAHAAYKLIVELRSRCARLRAIIPDYAKSAATLIALGTDQIFMSPSAELGPLDVQIGHPDRETETISGLDVASSYDFLGQLAVTMIVSGGGLIVRYTRLSRKEVLHETCQFVAKFLEPSVARLDPHIVSKAKRQLEVAERYATKMLTQRNVPEEYQLTPSQAKSLIQQLIQDYPVHEFVIVPDEARELNLPIVDIDQNPAWESMKIYYNWRIDRNASDVRILDSDDLKLMATHLQRAQEGVDSESEGEEDEQQNNTDSSPQGNISGQSEEEQTRPDGNNPPDPLG